jgi:hypothetical protein
MAALAEVADVRHMDQLALTVRSEAICLASEKRTRASLRAASPSLKVSRLCQFLPSLGNIKEFCLLDPSPPENGPHSWNQASPFMARIEIEGFLEAPDKYYRVK